MNYTMICTKVEIFREKNLFPINNFFFGRKTENLTKKNHFFDMESSNLSVQLIN
jgi:hypothetical protein